ncbi:hypothetical protein T265_00394 [Opisthorchis viverrini]|uniref:Uncharacterized protein n=1 Tax=Opisthorchis viverrini TaxID=6198 RepID=A0A075A2Z2_OPIVI|nr:hypothetical protein T265_00394 [Opisthorchis viverrini]KER33706.1 hypothetical protein T265_00394 [Opisthorchis viverrini]
MWNAKPHVDHRHLSCAPKQQSRIDLWNHCDYDFMNKKETNSSSAKNGPITQSAIQLNCYDNMPTRGPSPQRTPEQFYVRCIPDTSLSRRTSRKQCVHPTELLQHRSMIELDTSLRYSPTGDPATCTKKNMCSEVQSFQWLCRQSPSVGSPGSSAPMNSGFIRFTIQDLIQQESCMNPFSFPLDQPSRLVRIECRKLGCRCVLKNEYALALKIVPNVTMVQGNWILPKSTVNQVSKSHRLINNPWSHQNRTGTGSVIYPLPGTLSHSSEGSGIIPAPVILTTVCPSWFEIIHKTRSGPTDVSNGLSQDVPVWSTGKALWRARPKYFLIRKPTQCMFAAPKQAFIQHSSDAVKQDQLVLNINADNVVSLRAGTVLHLLGCRLTRLVHQTPVYSEASNNSFHSPASFMGRPRTKTISMLQCAIVGDKALADLASVAVDLPAEDALHWFTDGPRLVYIPLDSKSLSCTPVAVKKTVRAGDCTGKKQCDSGVFSLISLLTDYRLPLLLRPVSALRPNEWSNGERGINFSLDSDRSVKHPLLQITSCYHGDLIFLEPIFECQNPAPSVSFRSTDYPCAKTGKANNASRFFVVTPDMLCQHNFFVAESSTVAQHERELETHASRVAYFLAACHPAQGLSYLLKHLEDITQSSNTGPSHVPLTRTLGPLSRYSRYADMQSTIASLSATAALATDDSTEFTNTSVYSSELQSESCLTKNLSSSSLAFSGQYPSSVSLLGSGIGQTRSSLSSSLLASEEHQMNALCDEIEDIYYYVRNGRFPTQSRSMTSLAHHHATSPLQAERIPQTSAPISPQAYPSVSGRMHYGRVQKRSPKSGRQSINNGTEVEQIYASVPQIWKKPMLLVPNSKDESGLRSTHMITHEASSSRNRQRYCADMNGDNAGRFETEPKPICDPLANKESGVFMSVPRPVTRCYVPVQHNLVQSAGGKFPHASSKLYTNKKVLNMSVSNGKPESRVTATIKAEGSQNQCIRAETSSQTRAQTTFATADGMQPQVVRMVPASPTRGIPPIVFRSADLLSSSRQTGSQQSICNPSSCKIPEDFHPLAPDASFSNAQSQLKMVHSMNETSNIIRRFPTDSTLFCSSTSAQRQSLGNFNDAKVAPLVNSVQLIGSRQSKEYDSGLSEQRQGCNALGYHLPSAELNSRRTRNIHSSQQNTTLDSVACSNYGKQPTALSNSVEFCERFCTDMCSRKDIILPPQDANRSHNHKSSSKGPVTPTKSVFFSEYSSWHSFRPIPMELSRRQMPREFDETVCINDSGSRSLQFLGASQHIELSNSSPDTGIGVDSGIDVTISHTPVVPTRYFSRGNWIPNNFQVNPKEQSGARLHGSPSQY